MSQENEHLAALIEGSPDGLQHIYRTYFPRIRAMILRNGGQPEDAEDVFQDALVVLFRKCREENFQLTSSFYTLLYGVCRKIWSNRLQKSGRREVTLVGDSTFTNDNGLHDVVIEAEKQHIFWSAFKQLQDDCQRVMHLFFEKRSMSEIAATMGYASEGYAKKRKFQCKSLLMELVRTDPRFREYQSPLNNGTDDL